jgi:hypothetical protein
MPLSSTIALRMLLTWCIVVGFMAPRASYRARKDRLAWERLERAVAATRQCQRTCGATVSEGVRVRLGVVPANGRSLRTR